MDALTQFYFENIKKLDFYKQLLEKYYDEENLIQEIENILERNPINLYNPLNSETFVIRNSIFDSENERRLFLCIEKKLKNKYRILPEMCFRKVIKTEKYQFRNLTLYKFADYFICDKDTFKPILSIEFDEEHHRENLYEIIRDISKIHTLDHADIPHITINGTKNALSDDEIIPDVR